MSIEENILKEKIRMRSDFKEAVFARTKGKCCVPGCNCAAEDAHHILDRHLWNNGGYILSNGAALCAKHHIDAENGTITPRQCIEYMHISPTSIKKPDKIKDLSFGEYYELLMNDKINKWGE